MVRAETMTRRITTGIGIALVLLGQQPDVTIKIIGERGRIKIAVPDFKGPGVKPDVLQAFSTTLWSDLESSGVFEMASKSFYPTETPQKPEDFQAPIQPPPQPTRRLRPGETPAPAP